MTSTEQLITRLRRFNEWRRGGEFEQPEPTTLGRDIDDAIALLEQHIKLIDGYDELYSALSEMVNERQPLGIDRPVYRRALKLVSA